MHFEHLSCASGCGVFLTPNTNTTNHAKDTGGSLRTIHTTIQATCCELALASNEEDDKQKKSPNKKSGRLLFRDNSYDTLIQIFDKRNTKFVIIFNLTFLSIEIFNCVSLIVSSNIAFSFSRISSILFNPFQDLIHNPSTSGEVGSDDN